MSYTAYTAFIITVHHLTAGVSATLALIFTALLYWLIIKRFTKHRLIITLVALVASAILASHLSERVLQRLPVTFEAVQTN